MALSKECQYRLKLAQGYLNEARQDFPLKRWRSCVDNSQLAVENAAKCALAAVGPVGRTHNPAASLRESLRAGSFHKDARADIERIVQDAQFLGPNIHIQSDYGDEPGGRTPWELFGKPEATRALDTAEKCVAALQRVLQGFG